MKCIDFEDIASFDCFIAFSLHCGYRGLCKNNENKDICEKRRWNVLPLVEFSLYALSLALSCLFGCKRPCSDSD